MTSDNGSNSSISEVELDADHFAVDSMQSYFAMMETSAAAVPLPLESIEVNEEIVDHKPVNQDAVEDNHEDVVFVYRGEADGSVPEDVTHVKIEEGTIQVAEQVFRDCNDLVSVEFPSTGILCIGYMSFGSCWSLSSIRLPQSLNEIGPAAFHDCQSLTEVSLPPDIRVVSRWAFHDCSSLRNVSLPSSLEVICENAFGHCVQLQSIELPPGLLVIQTEAFRGCKSLVLIALAQTLEVTGDNVFRGAELLQDKLGESNEDIVGALKSRFSHLPLHKLFYSQAFQPLESTLQKLSWLVADSKGSIEMEDAFGMTPFHVAGLSCSTHQLALFQALLNQGDLYRRLLDQRDAFDKTAVEYLCTKDAPGAVETIRFVLNETVGTKVSCLGLAQWRQRIDHKINLCFTEDIDRIVRLERVVEVHALLTQYTTMEKTSILEQALWKAKMVLYSDPYAVDLNTIVLDREASRIQCGADIVIPNVLSYGIF